MVTTTFASPLGEILLAADGRGLTGLWFEGQEHFGTALQREVWYELLSIPRGEVATYGEIAQRVAARHRVPGNEDPVVSPRAVGAAVARNPVSIIVPCHRVVAADGSLNGYAGGLDRKEWLLRLEGAYED